MVKFIIFLDSEEIKILTQQDETQNLSLKALLYDSLNHLSEIAFQINEVINKKNNDNIFISLA